MANTIDRSVAILSIKPKYASRILDGTKKVELRRSSITQELNRVVIYCTAPVQRVVGYFSVGKIVRGAPSTIWRKYSEVAGISKNDYDKYFFDSHLATAIEIQNVSPFSVPLELSAIDRRLSPPQLLTYLPASIMDWLSTHTKAA